MWGGSAGAALPALRGRRGRAWGGDGTVRRSQYPWGSGGGPPDAGSRGWGSGSGSGAAVGAGAASSGASRRARSCLMAKRISLAWLALVGVCWAMEIRRSMARARAAASRSGWRMARMARMRSRAWRKSGRVAMAWSWSRVIWCARQRPSSVMVGRSQSSSRRPVRSATCSGVRWPWGLWGSGLPSTAWLGERRTGSVLRSGASTLGGVAVVSMRRGYGVRGGDGRDLLG